MTLEQTEGGEKLAGAIPTAVMTQTASRLGDTYRETHNQLAASDPGSRQQVWSEYIDTLKDFDVNDPTETIKAKAALDVLDQVLFASTLAAVSGDNGDSIFESRR